MASDIYSQVNDRILAALEQGIIPWKRPWTGRLPTNYDTGKEYRGINILLLESLRWFRATHPPIG